MPPKISPLIPKTFMDASRYHYLRCQKRGGPKDGKYPCGCKEADVILESAEILGGVEYIRKVLPKGATLSHYNHYVTLTAQGGNFSKEVRIDLVGQLPDRRKLVIVLDEHLDSTFFSNVSMKAAQLASQRIFEACVAFQDSGWEVGLGLAIFLRAKKCVIIHPEHWASYLNSEMARDLNPPLVQQIRRIEREEEREERERQKAEERKERERQKAEEREERERLRMEERDEKERAKREAQELKRMAAQSRAGTARGSSKKSRTAQYIDALANWT